MSMRFIRDENGELYVAPYLKVGEIVGEAADISRAEGYAEGQKSGYATGAAEGKESGLAEGEAAVREEFAQKRYIAIVEGADTGDDATDTRILKLEGIPFYPDIITVHCLDVVAARAKEGSVLSFTANLVSDDNSSTGVCGVAMFSDGSVLRDMAQGTANMASKFIWDSETLTATLGGLTYKVSSVSYNGRFYTDIRYAVILEKIDAAEESA